MNSLMSSGNIVFTNATIWKWNENCGNGNIFNGHEVDNSYIKVNIASGRIIELGKIEDLSPEVDALDMDGQLIIPGLNDSHIHVSMLGESRYFLDLKFCASIDDMIQSIKEHVINHPHLFWIQGINWDQTNLGRYPTRIDLDYACKDKPVFLWRSCWHIGVANTLALQLAHVNIESTSISISGGAIDTDASGVTGILRERAVESITSAMGTKSNELKKKFISEGLDLCVRAGLTSIQTNDSKSYSIYKSLQAENKLPLRVFHTPDFPELLLPSEEGGISDIPPYKSKGFQCNSISNNEASLSCADSLYSVDRVKLFSDGSLGAETAALRIVVPTTTRDSINQDDDTNDNSIESNTTVSTTNNTIISKEFTGILSYSSEELVRHMSLAVSKGYRLEVHAIGDAAAEQVLHALSAAKVPPSSLPILTHCQVLGRDLIEAMQERGVVANVQSSFVPTDMRWVSDRLSPQQIQYSYAWKTLLQSGVTVAGGSDSPIESHRPLLGMYDAMFRCSRDNEEDVFRPEERLSFAEALWIYTVGAAKALQAGRVLGSLLPGYAADFIALDAKVLTHPELLKTATPSLVVVGGRIVFWDAARVRVACSHSAGQIGTHQQERIDSSHNPPANSSLDLTGSNFDENTTSATTTTTTSTTTTTTEPIAMRGLFIPGKNGNHWFRCACKLLGKPCFATLK